MGKRHGTSESRLAEFVLGKPPQWQESHGSQNAGGQPGISWLIWRRDDDYATSLHEGISRPQITRRFFETDQV